MASSIVSSAAKQLANILLEEAKYLYAVKDKVEALHEELTWMHTFLQDADTREHREAIIRMWVSQIRDFAYDSEDIVESYVHKVSRHRQEGIWNAIKWFSCICGDAKALHRVGSDIDRLKQKISELCTRMQTYGVNNKMIGNPLSTNTVMELRRTNSRIERAEVVGLRGDTNVLAGKLGNSDSKVVCVTGMGGLGKTTLAKMVYREVKDEFKNRVWVYVSQQFQTRNILEAILLKLRHIDDQNRRNIKDLRDEELPSEVCKVLMERKCLVVLDDIWSEQAWYILKPAFKTLGRSQSKLLLTTRNERLLSHVDSEGFNHPAKSLTEADSWELLKKISFAGNATSAIDDEMEKLGEQMAKHCNGLPLALVVLGGILATKSTLEEWKKVQLDIDSCLKNGTSKQDNLSISQVLELSYDDLPYYLRPCFLHLGNFPEDFEIPTKRLYYMWEMEGLVAEPTDTGAGEVSVESIAEDYLKELANRCLVQLDRTGKTGKIKSCRLHDLIREMCLKRSSEENFLKVVEHGDLEKQSSSNSSSMRNQRFRRLAVYMHKSSNSLQHLISDENCHHVRSLLFFPAGEVPRKLDWPQGTVSEALKLVRVLHFEDICIRSLPKEIGDLIHLRYLSLKGTRVSNIPSSIGKLRYLQILDLRVCECIDVSIPNVIHKLESLKHLYLPNNWKVKPFLPNNWIEVGHPYLSNNKWNEYERKLRLRGLIQLESLENLRVEECLVKDILQLKKLRKVSLADYVVTGIECLKSFLEYSNGASSQRRKPLSLTLDGNMISKEPSILASNSHLQFHKLQISGKISMRLQYARIFPQDLKQLALNNCELEDDPMPILEKISQLTELTIGENTFLGTEMVCTAGNFPKLAILRLVQLTNLHQWTVEEGAMPELKKLYIYSCETLENIPGELPTEVKIGCRPCIEGVEKYGNCCLPQPGPAQRGGKNGFCQGPSIHINIRKCLKK